MEPFNFSYLLTQQDVKKNMIYQVFDRRRFNRIFLLYAAPIFAIIFLTLMIILQETDFITYFLGIFLLLIGPYLYWFLGLTAKKQYQKNELLRLKTEVMFDDEMILAKNSRGETRYLYTDITEVRENKDYIFVYIGPATPIPFPKAQIEQSIVHRIRETLLQKVPTKCKFKA